jgi:DNA-binding GntR family transcriptional regulator
MARFIQGIVRIELTAEQAAKLSDSDKKTLARGNRALRKARETDDTQDYARAARAFSELGIHFRVYG